jgi:hypothetical protein
MIWFYDEGVFHVEVDGKQHDIEITKGQAWEIILRLIRFVRMQS